MTDQPERPRKSKLCCNVACDCTQVTGIAEMIPSTAPELAWKLAGLFRIGRHKDLYCLVCNTPVLTRGEWRNENAD